MQAPSLPRFDKSSQKSANLRDASVSTSNRLLRSDYAVLRLACSASLSANFRQISAHSMARDATVLL